MISSEHIVIAIISFFVLVVLTNIFWAWKINRDDKKELETLKEINRIEFNKFMGRDK